MTSEEAAHWDRIEQDFPAPGSKYWISPDWINEWAEELSELLTMQMARTLVQLELDKIATEGFEADYDKCD